jgi:ubiquitin C-terminal hydrolase
MPVSKTKFQTGILRNDVEVEIISFLKERKESAYTTQEIMVGLDYKTDFSTHETCKISTFAVADFSMLLHEMVKQGNVQMKLLRKKMYYTLNENDSAKCPKCEVQTKPKKTWKMAGRPDKKGKRVQLHIGLYYCPKHGCFRKILGKRKI